jgi:hypothetical protein
MLKQSLCVAILARSMPLFLNAAMRKAINAPFSGDILFMMRIMNESQRL